MYPDFFETCQHSCSCFHHLVHGYFFDDTANPKSVANKHDQFPAVFRKDLNRQFLAPSAEEADFVVLEHCVTYAYHVLRGETERIQCRRWDMASSAEVTELATTRWSWPGKRFGLFRTALPWTALDCVWLLQFSSRNHIWCQSFIGPRRRQHIRNFRGGRDAAVRIPTFTPTFTPTILPSFCQCCGN